MKTQISLSLSLSIFIFTYCSNGWLFLVTGSGMRYVSTKKYYWLFEKWRSVGRTRNKSLGVYLLEGGKGGGEMKGTKRRRDNLHSTDNLT